MKKAIFVLLSMAILLLLAACGGAPDAHVSTPSTVETTEPEGSISPVESVPPEENLPTEDRYSVGTTATNELYQVTLKSTAFTNSILITPYGTTDKHIFANSEDFFTPLGESFTDEDGNALDGITAFGFSKDSDNLYLWYNLEFKYVGKEVREDIFCIWDFDPIVTYRDYTFDSPFMTFGRLVGEIRFNNCMWFNFNSDQDQYVDYLGLNIGGGVSDLRPLSKDIYEIRGVIAVPKAVAEDKDAEIALRLAGIEFVVQ